MRRATNIRVPHLRDGLIVAKVGEAPQKTVVILRAAEDPLFSATNTIRMSHGEAR